MDQATYNKQVDERADRVVRQWSKRDGGGLWDLNAHLAMGMDDAKVVDIVRNALSDQTDGWGGRPAGGPFHVYPCGALIARWPDRLPEEALGIIRDFMMDGVLERGNTENHWLMFYVGNLLAAERWPDAKCMWNGLSAEANRAEAMRWILGMIERTAVNGHHEYDSPQYHVEHMVPMITLADHAADPHLRRQVEQVLSLYVADMALEYYYGAWAGGHSREGYRENTWRKSGAISALQYLYFGDEAFEPKHHVHGFCIPPATAAYRPPALFAEMAVDRSTAHVVKKTKAPRTIYRRVEHEARQVRKYTYMSPSFALGSSQLGLPGPGAGPIDLISWDLTWRGENQQAKICCNHPYRSPERFSAFLVGYPQQIRRQIGSDKPYLQWPDRLFGASPYERMMQHEGTVIVLYKIPPDDEAPFINLFLPRSIGWVERDGWIMGDTGAGAYVALYPIGPYGWSEIREEGAMRHLAANPDQIDGWLLRIPDLHGGLVLEAREADNEQSFEAFCARRAALPPDLSGWPGSDRVAVETLDGNRMEMYFDGQHRVDGEAIDYDAYPLYEAPGVDAPAGTGKMTFRKGDQEVRLDFGVDASKPLLPIRVIG
ncbi:MAG: hypothetical protein F4Z81_13810 [Gemmatimonadetes bacterium]|nr:hypothetical protein [Gemmatimonadota bacterium]MYB62429.1 hypothetical protein [Gemmatimonadota bacterium]